MLKIVVGARDSLLSRKQVDEVFNELIQIHPQVEFLHFYMKTKGDIDQKTSLLHLEKTDFFTKELDDSLLNGECRIAIHSAKDLPDPLPNGLKLIALTKGVDSSDVLVLRSGDSVSGLKLQAFIGTSSLRRLEMLRELRADFRAVDIRGTIDKRLEMLHTHILDGVVIAEAALIRLQLTHLNRIRLQGITTPLQGRLAILARKEDIEMQNLFKCLNYE